MEERQGHDGGEPGAAGRRAQWHRPVPRRQIPVSVRRNDRAGNLWSADALPGTIRITAASGRLLGLLHLPTLGNAEPRKTTCASSLAFGGDDAKTLYITACEFIYAIPLRTPGVLEGPAQGTRAN
jgi:sugar lactone lactonase YvrE